MAVLACLLMSTLLSSSGLTTDVQGMVEIAQQRSKFGQAEKAAPPFRWYAAYAYQQTVYLFPEGCGKVRYSVMQVPDNEDPTFDERIYLTCELKSGNTVKPLWYQELARTTDGAKSAFDGTGTLEAFLLRRELVPVGKISKGAAESLSSRKGFAAYTNTVVGAWAYWYVSPNGASTKNESFEFRDAYDWPKTTQPYPISSAEMKKMNWK